MNVLLECVIISMEAHTIFFTQLWNMASLQEFLTDYYLLTMLRTRKTLRLHAFTLHIFIYILGKIWDQKALYFRCNNDYK